MHCPQCMNEMHEWMKKTKREGKILPQGDGSGGGRIGESVAMQSKFCGSSRNQHFMISFLCTLLLSPK